MFLGQGGEWEMMPLPYSGQSVAVKNHPVPKTSQALIEKHFWKTFLKIIFFIYFTFGSVGSSLLSGPFFSCGEPGLLFLQWLVLGAGRRLEGTRASAVVAPGR